ncbi:hypothetical protein [Actinoplanes utahensis]|uniref:hypothetical protein n=1 Tax=Actinoplanes utahensis TaxID=1869 RepID=UPI001F383C9C|nr:hypothetical protein [Actinoplanes utahensis]
MTDGERVGNRAPLTADGVDVGVADPGVPDLDQNIARPQVTALDRGAYERVGRGRRGDGVDGKNGASPFEYDDVDS